MNASEPLMNRRKLFDDVKTKFCLATWDKINGNPVLLVDRHPALRWHDTILGFFMERGNLSL